MLHGDQFLTGDLLLTLIRMTNKVLSLALIRTTSISENGTAHTQIKMATLMSSQGNVKVMGEILTLVPSKMSEPDVLWVWTGSYLKTTSIVPGMSVRTLKVVTISIPGHLLELVNPHVVDAQDHLSPEQMDQVVESKMPINSVTSLASENSDFLYKTCIGELPVLAMVLTNFACRFRCPCLRNRDRDSSYVRMWPSGGKCMSAMW